MIKERDRRGVADDVGGEYSSGHPHHSDSFSDRDGGRESGQDRGLGRDRDFGRDGVSGLVSFDRAMRARDVSRPGAAEEELAQKVVDGLIARAEGRPRRTPVC